ncbi:hypothetical protein ACHZ97_07750 [Lysobacter soli]|uniref:hypothetical protein n=1 Tax=Lysobacter soli TaxID=453783 RepID=UPI0037C6A8FE
MRFDVVLQDFARHLKAVIPAKAGIQAGCVSVPIASLSESVTAWIPAFAGMTALEGMKALEGVTATGRLTRD